VLAAVSIDARQTLGKHGEDLACRELRRRGYVILDRRYRTRMGEIDIVAQHEEATVFVEVKARRDGRFGGAAAAVTPWKQRRMVAMAVDYMARRRLLNRPCRFDVVTVEIGDGPVCVEVYTHAFEAY
jgi:putative endonuclease